MTWVRLDDSFSDHPKIIAAGPLGACLQIRALCYCARHLTDGFMPTAAVRTMTADFTQFLVADGAGFTHRASDEPWGDYMVNAGLWCSVPDGYKIHDYLKYNLPRLDVLRLRKQSNKRKISWRKRNASRNADVTLFQNVPHTHTHTHTQKTRSNGVLTDAQFLDSLRANPAYQGIDLERELGKMDAYLLTPKGKRRRKTRGFIVNWLNRVDTTWRPAPPTTEPHPGIDLR